MSLTFVIQLATLSIETMTRKFQFVAVLLALVIFLGSLPASARCVPAQQSKAPSHCAPNCPMMIHMGAMSQPAPDTVASNSPVPTNCCNVSSSRPESAMQVQAPAEKGLSPTVIVAEAQMPPQESAVTAQSIASSSLHSRFAPAVLRI
jgi:hypothetical protein